jgi:hypothetical protein
MARGRKRTADLITSKEMLDTLKQIAFSKENIERLEKSIEKLNDRDRVDFYTKLPKVLLDYEETIYQREVKSTDNSIANDDDFVAFVEQKTLSVGIRQKLAEPHSTNLLSEKETTNDD